ncbi:MAG TPA: hypothetical protein VGL61_25030 [Kofleriaceae bacterium]|jgi:hypothetical protein
MNIKALITTAAVLVGTSAAAFAGPRVEVVRGRAPVAVRVERARPARPARPLGHGPVVIERGGIGRPVVIRPVWHPIIRPIVRDVVIGAYVGAPCGDGLTTIGSFDVAFDGTQSIDLGAGRTIGDLRIAGDSSTEIYNVTVTYADGETQTINCDHYGSFETDLGGNVVTSLSINADHPTTAPLQVQA